MLDAQSGNDDPERHGMANYARAGLGNPTVKEVVLLSLKSESG
jgi:hypothetical protein